MSCTEDRFLKDTEDHSMKKIRDDGLYKHISFSRNGSSVYRFDLITWPGSLCITGDCGTYVFERVSDMFTFFVRDAKCGLRINPPYWGEKMESIDRCRGYEEFSQEKFKANIFSVVDDWEFDDKEQKSNVRGEVHSEIIDRLDEGEHAVMAAACDFRSEYGDYDFQDFWECDFQNYTFGYLWCLYAIVWGIKAYNVSAESRECAING